jgi:peptide chain release factor subunit 1
LTQAENIKSRTTRSGVLASLQKVLSALRHYREMPDEGVAIYASPEMVCTIEPNEPFLREVYHCGPKFMLDPLREQLEEKALYGLVVLDRKEVTVGLLRGKQVVPLDTKESHVPPKHGKGGQSQHRWERQTEGAAHEFFVKAGELANRAFLDQVGRLDGILVGGPGDTKREWAEGEFMDYRLLGKLLRPFVDVGYTNEFGLEELVRSGTWQLEHLSISKDRKAILGFTRALQEGKGEYGLAPVLKAIEEHRAESLLLVESMEGWFVRLTDAARAHDLPVHVLSPDGAPGAEFLKGFSGVGAVLRFRVTA